MEELVCTTLNNGVKLPAIGFNTSWECPSDQAALRSALTSGYRLLDTDPSAGNEIEIGQVLQDYFHRSFSREEVFISTKAWLASDTETEAVHLLRQSLFNLRLGYADLLILQLPDSSLDLADDTGDDRIKTVLRAWKAVEDLQKEGLTRSIGLANVCSAELQAVISSSSVKPAAVQIRQVDLFNDPKLVHLCRRSGVHVIVHLDPDQAAISWVTESSSQGKQSRKSAMQIAGRFFLERGMSVIIHEKDPDEIHKAFKMLDFCLSPEDVASLVTRRLVPSGF